jgi:molybdate transport system permease protein
LLDFLTPAELEAAKLSLIVGVSSAGFSLPFGIILGWLLARKNFIGKGVLDSLLHLPMVVPPVVTGYILLILFGKRGIIGKPLFEIFGFSFAFNIKGAALASAVIAFPLLVRAVRISMEGVDKNLEDAARTLGAGRLKVFFTITVPLCMSGIISGTVMAFARSLGEFGATITFVSNIPGETKTLPLALYSQLQIPGQEHAVVRIAVISLIFAFLALIASEYFARKNMQKRAS